MVNTAKHILSGAFLLLLCACKAQAQNLVLNPGFEEYDNCPTSFGEIACPLFTPPFATTVKNWISAIPNSPDYYNACSADTYATVPNNFYGHHPAHTGNAYVGISAFSGYLQNNQNEAYIEYIETKLKSPLLAGQTYEVSCYVKLAFITDALHVINIVGLHELGASFSNTVNTTYNSPLSDSFVGLRRPDNIFIDDTANWVKITGMYTAKGGEQWLTIGRFNTGIVPLYQQVIPASPAPFTTYQSYYLLDDVSVTTTLPCDTFAYNHDSLFCPPLAPHTIASSVIDGNGYNYTWSTGSTGQSITTGNAWNYWCMATDGCNLITDTFKFKPKAFPIDIVRLDDINVCHDVQVVLGKEYPGIVRYEWSNGDTSCCIYPKESGTYIINFVGHCEEFTDTIEVNIERCSDCLFVPNAFTPNADGLNDYFGVRSLCKINTFFIAVYNRWGQRVFTSNDVNFRWNGFQKADFAQTGTYYYYLEYSTVHSAEQQFRKGDITLLR